MNAMLLRWAWVPASLAFSAMPTAAAAGAVTIARTPTFSGNAWVALGIIAVLIGTIYLLIMGALHVERRDARLGNRTGRDDGGWFGIFPTGSGDDEDAPDFHHHDGGE